MQQHTLRLHTLVGGNEATLPARGITHLPTAATGLDDLEVRCEMEVRWAHKPRSSTKNEQK